MPPIETVLFVIAILLIISVLASKLSAKLSLPALALFLGIGMLAGSEGVGGIYFDDAQIARSIGIIALVFILFSGGLNTSFNKIQPVIVSGVLLATAGVLLTTLIIAGFVIILLDFSLAEAFLVGAIVAATDATAVFSVLGTQNIALKGYIIPLLELESGSNDPMAIFLTITALEIIQDPQTSIISFVPVFLLQMGIGLIAGLIAGYIAVRIINRLRLNADGLYPVYTIAVVLFTFGLTTLVGGSGFLAVYIMGLFISTRNFVHKKSLASFHDGLSWLMQIIMFLSLGLLVFPSQLPLIAPGGILIAIVLIFIARPISVFISLLFSRFNFFDKLMISWVGLRGATPIVLSTFPVLAGIPDSNAIFDIVFFVVLVSIILQGSTIVAVANLLGVTIPYLPEQQSPFELPDKDNIREQFIEITVSENSPAINRQIVNLDLPEACLFVLITRGEEILVPNGTTIIEKGDILLVLADHDTQHKVHEYI